LVGLGHQSENVKISPQIYVHSQCTHTDMYTDMYTDMHTEM
jgi:hypothetical protein